MSTTVNLSVAMLLFIGEVSVRQIWRQTAIICHSAMSSSRSPFGSSWLVDSAPVCEGPPSESVTLSFLSQVVELESCSNGATLALAWQQQPCDLCKQLLDVDTQTHTQETIRLWTKKTEPCVCVSCDQDKQSSTWARLRHSLCLPACESPC